MISLDQILLLEQRVESAVAKIAQLQAENDALRSKCSELTNALSSKSEQLSTFESDQNKIESGILKALDRLNSIENSVLKATGQVASFSSNNQNPAQQAQNNIAQQINQQNSVTAEQFQTQENISTQKEVFSDQQVFIQPEQNSFNEQKPVQFNTMQPVFHEEEAQQVQQSQPEQNQQIIPEQTPTEDENGQFDIF